MPTNYKRSKEEYLNLAEVARAKYGDTLTLPLIHLEQGVQDTQLFSMPLSTRLCHLLFQRLPRDVNNPEGIQRAFKATKIAEIEEAARNPKYSAPGAIIANIITSRPWVKLDWQPGQRTGRLTIDLKCVSEKLAGLEENGDAGLDEEKFMVGFMIDAHHRTEGHYQAGKLDLEMAATLYIDLPKTEMAGVFVGVNEKQEKPSPTHVLAMKYFSGRLSEETLDAVEIAGDLNEEPQSVLYQHVKTFDGRLPKGSPKTYVNLKPFTDLIEENMLPHLRNCDRATQKAVVEGYFRAWRDVFPGAWDDPDKHVLVKAMGFTIMGRLFPRIFDYVSLRYNTETPTQGQFVSLIKNLGTMRLTARDFKGISVQEGAALDWRSEVFGSLSSGKGLNALHKAIDKYLIDHRLELTQGS